MKYVTVDVETTGLNPEFCKIIEFAAIIDDTENQLPIDQLPKFHAFVKHDGYYWEPVALKMNWGLIKLMLFDEAPLMDSYNLVDNFRQFLSDNGVTKCLFAGKNFGSFDLQFCKKLPSWDSKIKYYHRSLDPALYYFNPDTMPVPPSLYDMAKGLGIDGNHRAMNDCELVIYFLRKAWYGTTTDRVPGYTLPSG